MFLQIHKHNFIIQKAICFQDEPSGIVYFVPVYLHHDGMSKDLRYKVFWDSFWTIMDLTFLHTKDSLQNLDTFMNAIYNFIIARALSCFFQAINNLFILCSFTYIVRTRVKIHGIPGLGRNECFYIQKIHFSICILS